MSGPILKPSSHGFVDLVIGVNYGDEGKGNTVDRLLRSGLYKIVARFNGGANAGHQLVFNGHEIALHQVPSGIAHDVINIIGNGSYVDPVGLIEELESIRKIGLDISPKNLIISDTSHYVLPHQILKDRLREAGKSRQGSTAKGIAFCGSEKYERTGARPELLVWDPDRLRNIIKSGLLQVRKQIDESALTEEEKVLHKLNSIDPDLIFEEWIEAAKYIQPYTADTFTFLHENLDKGHNILAEGAQSTGLDMEHGIYDLGTSSHTTPGGAMNGLGVGNIRHRIGVAKMTMSRVGGELGPFVTKIKDKDVATRLRGKRSDPDGEFGKTSGRERDMGYPDNTLIKRAYKLGVTHLVLTKMDLVPRFGSQIKIATAYNMNGLRTEYAPNSAIKLAACKPIYKTFATWDNDISGVRKYSELPIQARNLVNFIEQDTNLPVIAVGVGPDRDQVIFRNKNMMAA